MNIQYYIFCQKVEYGCFVTCTISASLEYLKVHMLQQAGSNTVTFPILNLNRLKSKGTSTIKKFVYFVIQAEF